MSISCLCNSRHQCGIRALLSYMHGDPHSRIQEVGAYPSPKTKEQYRIIPSTPYETTNDYQSMRWESRQWRSILGVWKKLDDRIFVSPLRLVTKPQFNYEPSDRHLLSWSCCVSSSPASETRIKRSVAENRLARESSDVISAIFVLLIRPRLLRYDLVREVPVTPCVRSFVTHEVTQRHDFTSVLE